MKKFGLGVLGLGEGRSIISAGLNSELWNVVSPGASHVAEKLFGMLWYAVQLVPLKVVYSNDST